MPGFCVAAIALHLCIREYVCQREIQYAHLQTNLTFHSTMLIAAPGKRPKSVMPNRSSPPHFIFVDQYWHENLSELSLSVGD